MLSLDQARERHAQYYLGVAQKAVIEKDLSRLERDLPNIRAAWDWVCREKRDLELITAYGEVAWQLFEVLRIQLSEAASEFRKLRLFGPNAVMLRQALHRLDEIVRTQAQIQAALGPNISASGERSVAGAIIVNSTVITGNHVVVQPEKR